MSHSSGLRHLAIIPARGGSKRLPRKNVVDFLGRPIISHTISAALQTALFARVLVSTEDDEITSVASAWGADVDRRPVELATDEATIVDVCVELVARLHSAGEGYDTITVLYATAPLRTAEDIRGTLALVEPGRFDFAIAASEFMQPVHQALRLNMNNLATPLFPDAVRQRAEKMDTYVAGNGSTYSATVKAFVAEKTFYGADLRCYLMPRSRAVDIDTQADLDLARFYASQNDVTRHL
jgi:CMP-N-acetylneuraminic acid synthetase